MVAGFDVAGLSGLSKQQERLLSLPKNFRIHKVQDNYRVITTSMALSVYGELDRAVAGLLPLKQVPIWEYNVPDYGSTLYAIHGGRYVPEGFWPGYADAGTCGSQTRQPVRSSWNWGGKVGSLTVGTSSLDYMGKVLAGDVP
ncbi:hypothetical protein B4915_13220 [Leucobacter massiliensis]|uniref:Uncharacterized protein n=2 Tax=Leucobacter massiliensis TaxID=1686285 RepID=A0A2S9QKI3_9MICO|nr:hypothetical protein B4915_13220 [Leucobacter massiliensis]